MVKLIVGQDQEVVLTPEALLRSRSLFFDAALKSCWQTGPGPTKTITLPADSPSVVNLYVKQLDGGAKELNHNMPSLVDRDCRGDVHRGWSEDGLVLAKLYAFSDRILDSKVKLEIEWLFAFIQPFAHVVNQVYLVTMPGSHMRKLCIVGHGPHWYKGQVVPYNEEFLRDIWWPLCRAPCQYLWHNVDGEWPSRT